MLGIKNEISNALTNLNLKATEISALEVNMTIEQIVKVFAEGKKGMFLWENFSQSISINNRDAWKWIKGIIFDKEIIMFFNPDDESIGYRFSNVTDVVSVLSETYGFEFYLTNNVKDYVLCFNHHDYLIGCGKVAEKLKKYIGEDI